MVGSKGLRHPIPGLSRTERQDRLSAGHTEIAPGHPIASLAGQASAAVVKGVDFRDAFGGLLGLGAVIFFMALCFRGDKNPPYPGFITNKREERKLTGDTGGSMEVEPE